MKRHLLILVFAVLVLTSGLRAQSALTLTSANVQLPTARVSNYLVGMTALAVPAGGSNMTWNYSNISLASPFTYDFSIESNASFPGSMHDTLNYDPLVTGYGIFYNEYYHQTTDGIQVTGLEFPTQSYTVKPVTGNPADSLWVMDQSAVYTTPLTYMPLPMTEGTSWSTEAQKRTAHMILTLTAYGLNKVPFDKISTFSRTSAVIGWGTLLLPATSGSQSKQALLVQREDARIDSFYLGGQPAPTALLTAFGLTQGMSTKTYKRLFHVPGMMLPALSFSFDPTYSTIVGAGFNRMASLGIQATAADRNVSLYPNPLAGTDLHINLSGNENSVHIQLIDLLGRVLVSKTSSGATADLAIPSNVPNSEYFVQVIGANGRLQHLAKVMLAR